MTTTATTVATTKPGGKMAIRDHLNSEAFKNEVARVLPKHCTPERMVRTGLTALMKTPKLASCTPESFLNCMLQLSQWGLEPDGRHAHLIPYGDVCTLILDYKGIVDLVLRSGTVRSIHADVVHEGDLFVYDLGEVTKHTPHYLRTDADTLPASIVKRLPVRFTYDTNYFNDTFQGIPVGGYTQIFDKLLDGIPVMLETDFFTSPLPEYKNLIYTGPIDKFFRYKHGPLEYKTVIHKHRYYPSENVQGCPVMNYCDKSVPYTRIIEHKHFEGVQTEGSWISTEFPTPYIVEQTDPYYPVNDERNNAIYGAYKAMADSLPNVYFGGRLAEYKYYDMHQVIESALNFCKAKL